MIATIAAATSPGASLRWAHVFAPIPFVVLAASGCAMGHGEVVAVAGPAADR